MTKSSGKQKGFLIAAIVLVAAVVCGLLVTWLVLAGNAKQGSIARVYQDNQLVKEVNLAKLTGEETFRVEGADGDYNVIVFSPEGVQRKTAFSLFEASAGWDPSGEKGIPENPQIFRNPQ